MKLNKKNSITEPTANKLLLSQPSPLQHMGCDEGDVPVLHIQNDYME